MVVFSPRPYFLPGIAAYHCQQAGEKLVKAVLIHRGIEPIRSDDIEMLIDGLPSTGRFTPHTVARFAIGGEGCRPRPAGAGRSRRLDW